MYIRNFHVPANTQTFAYTTWNECPSVFFFSKSSPVLCCFLFRRLLGCVWSLRCCYYFDTLGYAPYIFNSFNNKYIIINWLFLYVWKHKYEVKYPLAVLIHSIYFQRMSLFIECFYFYFLPHLFCSMVQWRWRWLQYHLIIYIKYAVRTYGLEKIETLNFPYEWKTTKLVN